MHDEEIIGGAMGQEDDRGTPWGDVYQGLTPSPAEWVTPEDMLAHDFAVDLAPPVFDEIMGYYPGDAEIVGAVEATKKILEVARDAKSPPPPLEVVPWDESDQPYQEIQDDGLPTDPGGIDDVEKILDGAEATAQAVIFGAGDGAGSALPLTQEIYDRLSDAGSSASYVRLDTPESYRAFRAACSPEMAALEQRVARLEQAFALHTQDGHGGLAEAVIGTIASDIESLKATKEQKRVPLQLPPFCDGKVDCWREGDVICCSIALPGSDGEVRICTSATPIAKHASDVVACANAAGADVSEMLGVLPTIACMMGGGSLLTRMAAATPSLLARPEVQRGEPFVGKIVPAGKPGAATLAALHQLALGGSKQATSEWQKLALASSRAPALAAAMKQVTASAKQGVIIGLTPAQKRWLDKYTRSAKKALQSIRGESVGLTPAQKRWLDKQKKNAERALSRVTPR